MDKPSVVFDLDDFAQDTESNAFNWFISFKREYPKFKVSLFTILGRWDLDMLARLKNSFDYIELVAHGFEHNENREVLSWGKDRWLEILNKYEKTGLFSKIFKAPNWEMSNLGYEVLKKSGWAVAVRQNQIKDVPIGMKYYCFETNMFAVHGHTWTMEAHEKENKFCNWGKDTNFQFISQNLEERI